MQKCFTSAKQEHWSEAIKLYEQAQLAGPLFDPTPIRDLYTRTLRWSNATDAYLMTLGPSHAYTLHLLYMTGRHDDYRSARRSALDAFEAYDGNWLYDIAAAVALMPLEEESHGQARKLADKLREVNAPEYWRRAQLGRLLYRLGEFDAWYQAEDEDGQRLRENRICAAILALQKDASDENRKSLERLANDLQAQVDPLVKDGTFINSYWWNYVRSLSYHRDAKDALRIPDAQEVKK